MQISLITVLLTILLIITLCISFGHRLSNTFGYVVSV